MYLPSTVLKNGNFDKASKKGTQQKVFKDKIVDSSLSPLLYNIETGILEMEFVVDGYDSNFKMHMDPVSADRGYLARKMLLKTNVSYVSGEREFTLLRTNKGDLKNKNITDETQYEETFNENTTAEDKFKDTNDPFYKSDEDQTSSEAYLQEVDENEQIAVPPDLSRIASDMVAMNMSKSHKGKAKYFIKHSSGVG
jgi:hypothetical protein